jgi:hypothetical protein
MTAGKGARGILSAANTFPHISGHALDKEDAKMQATEITEAARKLHSAMGDKAQLEAAQKAKSFEQQGAKDDAETWRRIEAALALMRGPRAK